MDHIALRSKLTYSTVRMLKLCKIHTFNKIFRNVHTSAVLYMDENAFICTNLYRYAYLLYVPHYIINILSWEPTLLPSRRNQPISVSWS